MVGQRTHVVATHPRFNGLYLHVDFLDFGKRGSNIGSPKMPLAEQRVIMTEDLQELVDEMVADFRPLPQARCKGYLDFQTTYEDCEVVYHNITITFPDGYPDFDPRLPEYKTD